MIAIIQAAKASMFTAKKKSGTKIILKFEPTKSEAACNTDKEICRLLHKHSKPSKYNKATPKLMPAPILKYSLLLFSSL